MRLAFSLMEPYASFHTGSIMTCRGKTCPSHSSIWVCMEQWSWYQFVICFLIVFRWCHWKSLGKCHHCENC